MTGRVGRPKKVSKDDELKSKLDKYLAEYELDDLNETNDRQSLMQLCSLEMTIEKVSAAIRGIEDLTTDSVKVKNLNVALRDATHNWLEIQQELGISRKKRQTETEETPLSYIERLKTESKKYLDSRLSVIKCDVCNLDIAKYHVYVTKKGEPESIITIGKEVELIKFSFSVECSRCGKIIEHNERTTTTRQ
jgi:hypothetical protein